VALDVGDDVEHRLAALPGHLVVAEAALRLAAPDLHLEHLGRHLGHASCHLLFHQRRSIAIPEQKPKRIFLPSR